MASSRELAHAGYKRLFVEAQKRGEEVALTRELALNDSFFLLIYILGITFADNDWVFDRCREVEKEPNGFIELWAREHFKDYPLTTQVLTQNRGWTTHGELVVGDLVFAPDGKPVRVTALSPRYEGNRCLKITLQGKETTVCGQGHLWRVIEKKAGKRDSSGYRAPVRSSVIKEAKDLKKGDNIGAILEPLQFPRKELPLDPYILGVWLGDGDSSSSYFTKHANDMQIIEEIRSRGCIVDEISSAGRNTSKWAIRGAGAKGEVKQILRDMGVLGNKHIPEEYLYASEEQRMDLLRGLMDTDGHCNTRGTASFASKRKGLAEQVLFLASSLALRPRFFVVNSKIKGEPYTSWRVIFQSHTDRPAFILDRKKNRSIKPSLHRLTNKVVSVEETDSVPTSCIQVEGGMYLVGRDLLPTHNSTIAFTLMIQDILRDPEITIGIFSYSRPIARSFLRPIKWQFEQNEKLKELFPEVCWQDPQKESPKWSEEEGLIVRRSGMPKEATVEAWGVIDGQPTSKHYRVLVYDDVVTKESVSSPEMINKTTDSVSLSFNLGSNLGGVRRFYGTRYHYADTYKALIDRGAVKLRLYGATKDMKQDGEPWLWTREILEAKIRDMGPYVASCQLFNTPVQEGEEIFSDSWLKYWIPDMRNMTNMNKYILVDPANEKKETSDYTVMAVVGLGPDGNTYLIDMIRDRLDLNERTNRLMKLHSIYKPLGVGYEKYGMQSDIQHMEAEMNRRNYRFTITPLGGNMRKNDRIKRLQPIFKQGRFYLPEALVRVDTKGIQHDLVQEFLQDEYRQFPYMTHDDMLDCISRICDTDMNVFAPEGKVDDLPSWSEEKATESYEYDIYSYA